MPEKVRAGFSGVKGKRPAIIKSIPRMAAWAALHGAGTGFVPTLGSLHEGHASLIKKARSENRFVAVSVFVNPLQFTEEGYRRYPRDLAADARFAAAAGADLIFAPDAGSMYPAGYDAEIALPRLFTALAGQNLEWHYRGVLAVVMKLLQIVRPRRAYFGLKDPHQLALIETMVRAFNVPVKIRKCPTVRERDGLARSSRNALLNRAERAAAPVIYRALLAARRKIKEGKGADGATTALRTVLAGEELARLEYCEVMDPATFKTPVPGAREALVFASVWIGGQRLTDNIRFRLR